MTVSVRQLMRPTKNTVLATARVSEAIHLLTRLTVQELYVVSEQGKLLGIVTDYSLLKSVLNEEDTHRTVDEILSRSLKTVDAQRPVSEVVCSFRDSIHARMPVIDDDVFVGVLSRADILRHLASHVRTGKAFLPECEQRQLAHHSAESAVSKGPHRGTSRPSSGMLGGLTVTREAPISESCKGVDKVEDAAS